jgi:hypothetical protein
MPPRTGVYGRTTSTATPAERGNDKPMGNAAGRRLLARYHRLKTRLTVTATGAKKLGRTASLRSPTPAKRGGRR